MHQSNNSLINLKKRWWIAFSRWIYFCSIILLIYNFKQIFILDIYCATSQRCRIWFESEHSYPSRCCSTKTIQRWCQWFSHPPFTQAFFFCGIFHWYQMFACFQPPSNQNILNCFFFSNCEPLSWSNILYSDYCCCIWLEGIRSNALCWER